MMLLPYIRS